MKSDYDYLVDEHIIADSTLTSFEELENELTPDTVISITQCIGGSEAIFSYSECKIPMKISTYIKKFLGLNYEKKKYKHVWFVEAGANNVTSNINHLLSSIVPKDMTVYGKICTLFNNMQFDHIFIPYRITTKIGEEEFFEWSTSEVIEWTEKIRKDYPYISNHFYPLSMIYHGKVKNLKIGGKENDDWFIRVEDKISNLDASKSEKYYDSSETNALVVRIDNDQLRRAFKIYKAD